MMKGVGAPAGGAVPPSQCAGWMLKGHSVPQVSGPNFTICADRPWSIRSRSKATAMTPRKAPSNSLAVM